jgi:hypothetical protein
MGTNPFATPPPRPGQAPAHVQNLWGGPGRYSVPGVYETTDPDYTTGYSPTLAPGGSSDGSQLPDNVRIGRRELPVGENYNEPGWQSIRHAEQLQRQTEDHTEDMWSIKQDKLPAPRVPLWEQARMPTRPTATNSPTGYGFQRYWHIPRNVADVFFEDSATPLGASRQHFSMADHRRKYEIMGMRPQGRTGVNTYRASPRPWDENLYQAPAAPSTPTVPRGLSSGGRAYRLGV